MSHSQILPNPTHVHVTEGDTSVPCSPVALANKKMDRENKENTEKAARTITVPDKRGPQGGGGGGEYAPVQYQKPGNSVTYRKLPDHMQGGMGPARYGVMAPGPMKQGQSQPIYLLSTQRAMAPMQGGKPIIPGQSQKILVSNSNQPIGYIPVSCYPL
jgi:hypothetical protein